VVTEDHRQGLKPLPNPDQSMSTSDAYIMTHTGRRFRPLDPRPEDVCLEDIAAALSKKCRFGGHCRQFYSVASHSMLVGLGLLADECPPDVILWGLLHDAAEAYLEDLPRPLKDVLPGYRASEERLLIVIAERFGLTWPMPVDVVRWDNIALVIEAHALMPQVLPHLPELAKRQWQRSLETGRHTPQFELDAQPENPTHAERTLLRWANHYLEKRDAALAGSGGAA
jgi:hypothetical protein